MHYQTKPSFQFLSTTSHLGVVIDFSAGVVVAGVFSDVAEVRGDLSALSTGRCIGGVGQVDEALESDDGDAVAKKSSSSNAASEVDEPIESEDSVREEQPVFDLGIATGAPVGESRDDFDCSLDPVCCCEFGDALAAAAASLRRFALALSAALMSSS